MNDAYLTNCVIPKHVFQYFFHNNIIKVVLIIKIVWPYIIDAAYFSWQHTSWNICRSISFNFYLICPFLEDFK